MDKEKKRGVILIILLLIAQLPTLFAWIPEGAEQFYLSGMLIGVFALYISNKLTTKK